MDLGFLLIFLVFVTTGFSIFGKDLLMGVLGILFFGLGATIIFIQLITNASYLKLNNEGFEERTLLKTKSFRWKDVSNFEIRSFRWNKRIHFDHIDKFGNNNWRSIVSTYTIKTPDLIELMKEYKKKSKTYKV